MDNNHTYKINDEIIHSYYGEGTIIEINDEVGTIYFKNLLIHKNIYLNHPSLKKKTDKSINDNSNNTFNFDEPFSYDIPTPTINYCQNKKENKLKNEINKFKNTDYKNKFLFYYPGIYKFQIFTNNLTKNWIIQSDTYNTLIVGSNPTGASS